MPHTYTLKTLPTEIKEILSSSYHADNVAEHRQALEDKSVFKQNGKVDLFSTLMGNVELPEPEIISASFRKDKVIWATDNYESKGFGYGFDDHIHDLDVIVPRVEKSKAEQKRRSKEKAEVFTPSWVCNVQNNLIDDHMLYDGAFNTVSEDRKTWTPNKKKVRFNKKITWLDYVLQRRLELTAGEAPYLMSRYDTTTGEEIPVRERGKGWCRIGLLDRKLRVVSENVGADDWYYYARLAFITTFGYEWQGDNLLLARLNMLNTFIDYHHEVLKTAPSFEQIKEIAEIASWNLWQMDGLKMVEPLTCSVTCEACKKKNRFGHDGKISTIRVLTTEGFVYKNFEDFVYKKI